MGERVPQQGTLDDWEKLRRHVLNRDEDECRFCGMSNDEHMRENGKELHVHHVIPRKEGGRDVPWNLIAVCNACHRTIEATQAEALSRIKAASISEAEKEQIEEEMQDLRAEKERLERVNKRQAERVVELSMELRMQPDFETLFDELLLHLENAEVAARNGQGYELKKRLRRMKRLVKRALGDIELAAKQTDGVARGVIDDAE